MSWLNGILIANKKEGLSSFEVVNMIRRKTGIKKVGHCGTLDPIAEGVLIICIGKATKLFSLLSNTKKVYDVTVVFGFETDTLDITGKITDYKMTQEIPSINELDNTIKCFIGQINQVPPMYSAVKLNGKRLYQYARDNQIVEPLSRKVMVYSIDIIYYQYPYLRMNITCGKGTYIRSLCRDIAYKLGTYVTMVKLIRKSVGQFSIENSISYDSLINMRSEDISNFIIKPEELFF